MAYLGEFGTRVRRPRWLQCDRARDRGVTSVEYALVIGLCSAVTIAAISSLGGHSADALSTAAAPAPVATTQGSSGGPGTTAAQITPPPPSTTTPPSSTTTSPPVATSAPSPTVASASLDFPTGLRSGNKWTAGATLTIVDDLGQAVQAAVVTVRVRYYQRGNGNTWRWQEQTQDLTTGPDGITQLSAGPYKWNTGKNQVTQVEFSAQAVSTPDGLPWDQTAPSLTIDQP